MNKVLSPSGPNYHANGGVIGVTIIIIQKDFEFHHAAHIRWHTGSDPDHSVSPQTLVSEPIKSKPSLHSYMASAPKVVIL